MKGKTLAVLDPGWSRYIWDLCLRTTYSRLYCQLEREGVKTAFFQKPTWFHWETLKGRVWRFIWFIEWNAACHSALAVFVLIFNLSIFCSMCFSSPWMKALPVTTKCVYGFGNFILGQMHILCLFQWTAENSSKTLLSTAKCHLPHFKKLQFIVGLREGPMWRPVLTVSMHGEYVIYVTTAMFYASQKEAEMFSYHKVNCQCTTSVVHVACCHTYIIMVPNSPQRFIGICVDGFIRIRIWLTALLSWSVLFSFQQCPVFKMDN